MRRIDKCGRDITELAGLHDENDLVELTVQIPANAWEYIRGNTASDQWAEFAAGCYLHLSILQMMNAPPLPEHLEAKVDEMVGDLVARMRADEANNANNV